MLSSVASCEWFISTKQGKERKHSFNEVWYMISENDLQNWRYSKHSAPWTILFPWLIYT